MNQHFYKDLVLFIISILVISCAKGESTKQTIDEQIAPNGTTIRKDALYYWDQTGLNYAFFKEHISTDTCYQSPEIFIGCMEAVNSILKFYNLKSDGSKVFEKSYILKKGSVKEGDLSNPDLIISINSNYLSSLTNKNFCEIIKKAYSNGDVSFETSLSKVSLAWKFKSMMKYKSCLGL